MPRRYYFHFMSHAAIVDIPTGYSSDAWGSIRPAFVEHCLHRKRHAEDDWVDALNLEDEWKFGPVHWHEELAGSGGCSFVLLPLPDATEADIKACTRYLKASRDVVRLKVIRPKHWTEFHAPADEKAPQTSPA